VRGATCIGFVFGNDVVVEGGVVVDVVVVVESASALDAITTFEIEPRINTSRRARRIEETYNVGLVTTTVD
jgi:ABC-type phosphate transport system ATPase subunit